MQLTAPLKILVTLLIFFATTLFAAEPLEFRPVMTLIMANKMADACEARAKAEGWKPVNIAIFDQGGNLKLFRRQDDAYLGSIEIAQLKARSSVMLPFSTRFLGEKIAYKDPARPHGIELVPGVVVFPGGLPVKTSSGHLIGSIGVSGATSDQDESCAQSGINAIQNTLTRNNSARR